ncbi:major capsid protein [Xenophilus sp. Marseille-Q4582]|uniref:major capsid protein n=1 Tax=Xenophilus sp. Marseille-Q4582 TaxID=2866600 RepID=UPI001CE4839D|nr:major capsid protein [Xenophilus sp. Marseille-Q4582]
MALANMKVFNEAVQESTIETLAQMVQAFNAASRGTLVLTAEGFQGDYRQRAYWASLASARRRVDRYATNGTASPTALAQLQENGVKIAGGFGPVLWEPGQLTWVEKNPAEAVAVISQALAEGMLQDQLNTAIAALVAALQVNADSYFDTGTGPLTYRDLNSAHAKFGDMSNTILANVMDGTSYHNLIDNNLANGSNLFQSTGVTVVDILGKAVIVTDAPALRQTGTGANQFALGLAAGAATVFDGSDLITNVEQSNGKNRIETTFQADYTFGLALKGYTWDTATGGKSPTDIEIATGSNWDRVATSVKHTAGVLAIANA